MVDAPSARKTTCGLKGPIGPYEPLKPPSRKQWLVLEGLQYQLSSGTGVAKCTIPVVGRALLLFSVGRTPEERYHWLRKLALYGTGTWLRLMRSAGLIGPGPMGLAQGARPSRARRDGIAPFAWRAQSLNGPAPLAQWSGPIVTGPGPMGSAPWAWAHALVLLA